MAGPIAVKLAVQASKDPRLRRLVLGVLVALAGLVLLLLLLTAVVAGTSPTAASSTGAAAASAEALTDIPPVYLGLYQQAAAERGVDWAVLAAIGKVECDHGRAQLAGCNPPGSINTAGARGPMQFLGSTWRSTAADSDLDVAGPAIPEGQEGQGYATDADRDGTADPWSATDAVHASARFIARNGAPADYQAALLAYNNDARYVENVLGYAERYRAPTTDTRAGFTDANGAVPLSDVACPGGGTTTVHAQLGPAVAALYADAERAGHLLCGGGYRSNAQQIELRRAHCGTSDYAIYEMPSSQCSPPTARPGASMHEQGLAIDLTCNGSLIRSRDNACSDWLEQNAASYGLRPLSSEAWHYSTNGN